MKLPFVLALLLCFSVASALKCYECNSQTSMSDCESRKTVTECDAGQARCGKASIEYIKDGNIMTKSYAKGCGTVTECYAGSAVIMACKKIDGAICKWNCCSGDLCNGGTAPVVSIFLMVAGALLALFR